MRLKKTLAIALAFMLLPTVASGVSAATQPKSDIQVVYNAKSIVFPDQKPVIKNSRTLVPIRPIAEGLGFKVDWDSKTQTVGIAKASSTVNLVINQKTAKRNGQAITLDTPAQIINGRTMVPVRFIAEALSYQVNWNASEQKVLISDQKPDQKLYASLENVALTNAEADKQYNVYRFIFTGNKELPGVFTTALRTKTANEALYGKYLMAVHGSKFSVQKEKLDNLVAQAKNAALDRNKSQDAMNKEMVALGITDQDIRDFFTYDLYTASYVQSTLTEQELLAYYNQHPELYTVASVRHILVATEAEAKQVIDRLAKGEKFADLAKALSTDPGSKNNGGLYENALVSNWVGPFRDAAVKQPIGKVGKPVKTQFGYHVILVEKRSVAPFQTVKADVIKEVVNDKTKVLRAEALKNKK
ncbi:stalk domain-containing protein [Brevibacillus sp. SYSU BS000544]|uniref:stalk domain-containing protein n=1 Tax=Brevibacillus sp. SYSU BS000544 TaxID=3416443 RepID=UPI003CE5A0EF